MARTAIQRTAPELITELQTELEDQKAKIENLSAKLGKAVRKVKLLSKIVAAAAKPAA